MSKPCKQLKRRSALIVQGDDFAVNDGILNIEDGNRVLYFREFAAQILIRVSLPPRSAKSAVTVEFDFVDPNRRTA
jgi:hypothetical protein